MVALDADSAPSDTGASTDSLSSLVVTTDGTASSLSQPAMDDTSPTIDFMAAFFNWVCWSGVSWEGGAAAVVGWDIGPENRPWTMALSAFSDSSMTLVSSMQQSKSWKISTAIFASEKIIENISSIRNL